MFYSLLGRIASVNRRLHRTRINFIPLDVALMAALGAGCLLGVHMITEARANVAPRAVTVDDIIARRVSSGTWVTMKGLLDARVILETGSKGSNGKLSEVKARYAPLVDESTGRAVFVALPLTHDYSGTTRMAFSGMLRGLPDVAKKTVDREGGNVRGIPVELDHALMLNQEPASEAAGFWLIAFCAPVLALMLFAAAKRHTIFRKSAATAMPTASTSPIEMRATGTFRLNVNDSERFVEMPVGATLLQSGEVMLLANVDASSSFFGVRTSQREGMWTLVLPHGAMGAIERGEMFFAGERRPAAQIEVGGSTAGKRQTVVLSFDSFEDRERLLLDLQWRYGTYAAAA